MFTLRKLNEIKCELSKILAKDEKELTAWLQREKSALKPGSRGNPRLVEDLVWLEEMLREAVKDKKSQGKQLRNRKAKKALVK
jgi:hypothetical protein